MCDVLEQVVEEREGRKHGHRKQEVLVVRWSLGAR